MSRDLVVHYKGSTYLIQPTEETRGNRSRKGKSTSSRTLLAASRSVTRSGWLPYSGLDQQPLVPQGEIVENKRLRAVLGVIRASQDHREVRRLASTKIFLRVKERIQRTRAAESATGSRQLLPGMNFSAPVAAYFARFAEEPRTKRKRFNDVINERKRQEQIAAALTREVLPENV